MSGSSQSREKVISTRVLSIVVSLALSFFLWLALSGQDTSTTELTVPLELANMPTDLAIKSELPTSVTFQILANTAQLRFLNDRKLHVWINASTAREGFNAFSVDPGSLELPRGVQVRRVTPQLIEFEAIKTSSKTVPLRPTVSGALNSAFRVRSMTLDPDRVTVQGPRELMENLTELATTPIPLEGLTKDVSLTVTPAVADLDPVLIVTPREIRAIVNVEERTVEETFTGLPIELDIKNADVGGDVNLSPKRADVTVSWPASRSRAVSGGDVRLRLLVDMDRLSSEKTQSLPLVAVSPSGTTVTGISPVNVTVVFKPAKVPEATAAPEAAPSGQPASRN